MKISGKTNNISYAHTNDGGADLRSNDDTIICAGRLGRRIRLE